MGLKMCMAEIFSFWDCQVAIKCTFETFLKKFSGFILLRVAPLTRKDL